MANMEFFKQTLQLSDQLINFDTKEDIAQCARLLEINSAHYGSLYLALSLDVTIEMTYTEEMNQTQKHSLQA
ncbi:MAG: hypothetical protein V4629_10320 [Pseudomonadota bacterium]